MVERSYSGKPIKDFEVAGEAGGAAICNPNLMRHVCLRCGLAACRSRIRGRSAVFLTGGSPVSALHLSLLLRAHTRVKSCIKW